MSTVDHGVRVVVAFGQHSVGRILFPPAAFRQVLIARGFVVPVEPPPEPEPEGYLTRVMKPRRRAAPLLDPDAA